MNIAYAKRIQNNEPIEAVYLSNSRRIELGYRQIEGRTYLDLREWVRYHGSESFRPTKHGLCIELSVWKNYLLPALNRVIEADFRLVDGSSSTIAKPECHKPDTKPEEPIP